MNAIQFENVSLHIKGRNILYSSSGSFPKGRITILDGTSGAGKTTILKLCNGLINPSNGNIYIEGNANL